MDNEEVKQAASIETIAGEYGWNPEGEKSAEEYVKVALEKLPKQSKNIKQLYTAIEDLKAHLSKSEEKAYERAKQELEVQRKEAISKGDVERVEALEQQAADLKPQSLQSNTKQEEVDPAITAFEEKYSNVLNGVGYEDVEIQRWLHSYGNELGQLKKLPVEQHMKVLEDHMLKKFKGYFIESEEDEREPKSPVSASRDNLSTSSKKGKKPTFHDLSDSQKKVASNFERKNVMSIQQYIDDLVKHGEL